MCGEKTAVLIEALPYIKKFRGKTFVIKYGGSIMKSEEARNAFIEDVVLLKLVGINIVIVHGGGPNISDLLSKLNIETEFVKGLRITDKKTMEAVEMILSGQVNKEITGCLCQHGISALGISGRDSNLIEAKKKYLYDGDEMIDIGYVGEVVSVNSKLLEDLLEKGYLPVISPVGCDQEGNIYNINADYVAAAVSASLQAEKLILLSDVKGLYKDINEPSTFISSITVKEIVESIRTGMINGGMIPKMECCMEALEKGTKNIHLIDGRKEHSLLLEIFTDSGIGTMVIGG
ncbi:MAG: acetylglutamate kinase [Bacillota bacterium]